MRTAKSKIFKLNDLLQLTQTWREEGSKIVFTNGCFDIIHPGHSLYLESARALGDKLIVGVNTDQSVSKLKGEHRPIVHQDARLLVLAALECVDAVVLFDEETPIRLIESISPQFLVKGGDYQKSNIVGADFVISHGGAVETIPLVEGFSTTAIEEKIRKS